MGDGREDFWPSVEDALPPEGNPDHLYPPCPICDGVLTPLGLRTLVCEQCNWQGTEGSAIRVGQ